MRFPQVLKRLILVSCILTPVAYADTTKQQIIFLDGREVLLNKNGTWQYLSTDRYANTKDGTRVRLKADGSWQTVGNALLTSKEQVRTNDLDIKLQKVVIETFKKKSQKNTKVKTQTVFYVQLAYSAQAKNNIRIYDDISLVEVNDNNGENYAVLSVQTSNTGLKPGTKTTLVIRAEKSPSIWDDVKTMNIVFKKGILGLKSPITLTQRTIDFDEADVDGFDN